MAGFDNFSAIDAEELITIGEVQIVDILENAAAEVPAHEVEVEPQAEQEPAQEPQPTEEAVQCIRDPSNFVSLVHDVMKDYSSAVSKKDLLMVLDPYGNFSHCKAEDTMMAEITAIQQARPKTVSECPNVDMYFGYVCVYDSDFGLEGGEFFTNHPIFAGHLHSKDFNAEMCELDLKTACNAEFDAMLRGMRIRNRVICDVGGDTDIDERSLVPQGSRFIVGFLARFGLDTQLVDIAPIYSVPHAAWGPFFSYFKRRFPHVNIIEELREPQEKVAFTHVPGFSITQHTISHNPEDFQGALYSLTAIAEWVSKRIARVDRFYQLFEAKTLSMLDYIPKTSPIKTVTIKRTVDKLDDDTYVDKIALSKSSHAGLFFLAYSNVLGQINLEKSRECAEQVRVAGGYSCFRPKLETSMMAYAIFCRYFRCLINEDADEDCLGEPDNTFNPVEYVRGAVYVAISERKRKLENDETSSSSDESETDSDSSSETEKKKRRIRKEVDIHTIISNVLGTTSPVISE